VKTQKQLNVVLLSGGNETYIEVEGTYYLYGSMIYLLSYIAIVTFVSKTKLPLFLSPLSLLFCWMVDLSLFSCTSLPLV